MKPSIKQRWTPLREGSFEPPKHSIRDEDDRVFVNKTHTVIVSPDRRCDNMMDGWVLLSIRRNDRAAECDWRIFMRIKNEIVGPDREAIQLFPGMRRVVDTANQYFLFVAPAGYIFGLGQIEREVSDSEFADTVGAKQRDFEPDDPLQLLVCNEPRSERAAFFPIPLYPDVVLDLMKKSHAEDEE